MRGLSMHRSLVEDETGEPFGPATVFVSYFWQAPFVQLADAIERRDPPRATKFWIDILNVAQCRHTPQAALWNGEDVGKFSTAIRQSQASVWLHCEPWYAPATFKRVWCLDEVMAAIDTANGFDVLMSLAEEADLKSTLSNSLSRSHRFDIVLQAFATRH